MCVVDIVLLGTQGEDGKGERKVLLKMIERIERLY